MTRGERIRDWIISPLMPLCIVIVGVVLSRPWGEFPVNDDWQYAHIARTFADTGQIVIDRPIAPALVVQTI